MKENEVKEQTARIIKYQELERIRNEVLHALSVVTRPWVDTGPCGQGPFTGNTRESRRVDRMLIEFTATRGGACAVSTDIVNPHIEAWELGRVLESMLREKLKTINAEMEKL